MSTKAVTTLILSTSRLASKYETLLSTSGDGGSSFEQPCGPETLDLCSVYAYVSLNMLVWTMNRIIHTDSTFVLASLNETLNPKPQLLL